VFQYFPFLFFPLFFGACKLHINFILFRIFEVWQRQLAQQQLATPTTSNTNGNQQQQRQFKLRA